MTSTRPTVPPARPRPSPDEQSEPLWAGLREGRVPHPGVHRCAVGVASRRHRDARTAPIPASAGRRRRAPARSTRSSPCAGVRPGVRRRRPVRHRHDRPRRRWPDRELVTGPTRIGARVPRSSSTRATGRGSASGRRRHDRDDVPAAALTGQRDDGPLHRRPHPAARGGAGPPSAGPGADPRAAAGGRPARALRRSRAGGVRWHRPDSLALHEGIEAMAYGNAGLGDVDHADLSPGPRRGLARLARAAAAVAARHRRRGCSAPGRSTEPHRSDVAAITAGAVRDGDGWRLNGRKMFITNAAIADALLVLCRTGGEGARDAMTTFVVPMDTPGIEVARTLEKMGLRSSPTCRTRPGRRPDARHRPARRGGRRLAGRDGRARLRAAGGAGDRRRDVCPRPRPRNCLRRRPHRLRWPAVGDRRRAGDAGRHRGGAAGVPAAVPARRRTWSTPSARLSWTPRSASWSVDDWPTRR